MTRKRRNLTRSDRILTMCLRLSRCHPAPGTPTSVKSPQGRRWPPGSGCEKRWKAGAWALALGSYLCVCNIRPGDSRPARPSHGYWRKQGNKINTGKVPQAVVHAALKTLVDCFVYFVQCNLAKALQPPSDRQKLV